MGKLFKYKSIANSLNEEISKGIYKNGDLLPSEKVLADRFSVERGSVRRAIDILIASGAVRKISGVGTQVIAKETDASLATKDALQRASNAEIGFIIADNGINPRKLAQPYYADLFFFLEEECRKTNQQLIYASIDMETEITEFLKNHNFVYIIFVSRTPSRWIKEARENNIPAVLVNDVEPGMVSISCDHSSGAYSVIEYLSHMNHSNIALIAGPCHSYTSEEKLAGCFRAFNDFNINFNKDFLIHGNWEYQSGYDCAKTILESERERPSALFAFNDMMCIGAIKAIQDAGLIIPDDISVVGFDNMEQLKFTCPNLTTVDSNTKMMARVIINYIQNPIFQSINNELSIKVESTFIERTTVKKRE